MNFDLHLFMQFYWENRFFHLKLNFWIILLKRRELWISKFSILDQHVLCEGNIRSLHMNLSEGREKLHWILVTERVKGCN